MRGRGTAPGTRSRCSFLQNAWNLEPAPRPGSEDAGRGPWNLSRTSHSAPEQLLSSPLLGPRGDHLHLAPLPNWGPPPPTVCKSLALESSSVPSTSPRLFWLPAWLEQRWGLVARTPLGAHHPFVAAICPCQSRDSRPQWPPITAQASQFRHRQPISASADRSGPPPPAPARRPQAQVHLQPPPARWTPAGYPFHP